MLNINFTKKKFNKLLLSINKLIESFFNNLSHYIKDYKKKNLKFRDIDKRVIIGIGSLFILILSYFLAPSFYDKNFNSDTLFQ